MTPDVSPARTEVLLALIAVYQRDGRATVPAVALRAGRSRSTTHRLLVGLKDLGLCDWPEGAAGTLRPTVGPAQGLRTCVRSGVGGSATIGPELSDPGAAGNSPGSADVTTLDEEPST